MYSQGQFSDSKGNKRSVRMWFSTEGDTFVPYGDTFVKMDECIANIENIEVDGKIMDFEDFEKIFKEDSDFIEESLRLNAS